MKQIGVLLLVTGAILASCVKNNLPYVPPVDENFNWNTTEKVTLNIPLAVSSAVKSNGEQYASTVKVYTSPLYSESTLLASGAAYGNKPFETVIDLPKNTGQVFVKLVSPRGLVTFTTYDIVGNKAVKSNTKRLTKSGELSEPNIPKPSFPTRYDVILGKNDDLNNTFTESKTYYIPQGVSLSTTNTNLLANWIQTASPKLYVAGNLVLGGKNSGSVVISYSSIVVLNGGSVTIRGRVNLAATQSGILAIYVQKGGKLILEQGLDTDKGINLVNEGKMEVKGTQMNTLVNGTSFYNTGEINFSPAQLRMSNQSMFYNLGEMGAEDLFLDSGSKFNNYKAAKADLKKFTMANDNCSLYQHGFFEVDGIFSAKGRVENYGKIACEELTDGSTFNYYGYAGSLLKTAALYRMSNATFTLEPESIVFVYQNGNGNGNTGNWNVKFENPVADNQNFALILWGVSDTKPDNTIINSKGETSFNGNIENYCPKKNDSQNEKYTADYCTNHAFWGGRIHDIPESDYNEGLGDTGGKDPVDKDQDGVPEGEDVDDNDPTVSHVSYFPSAGTWGSYFFEDLWPHIGDYDMNDIVLDFRIAYYTKGEPTAANPVVYMDVDWKLRAVGSQMQLAFGIQLDKITPEGVSALSNTNSKLGDGPIDRKGNNGLESGQSKAVFALFNNPAELFGASTGINVFRSEPKMMDQQRKVQIRFREPVAKENLSVANINPFIVVASAENNMERGREVHLSTNLPTDKINTGYYHQGFVSNTNPYKATSGMVWGYMVPQSFRYPAEMISITNAYPNFVKWYQSAGAEHNDWYDTSITGNTVETYLYEPKNTVN